MSRAEWPEPPARLERFLRARLPEGVVGDSILGDAREEYAEHHARKGGAYARRWYLAHAVRLAGSYAWHDLVLAVRKGREVDVSALLNDLKAGFRGVVRMPGSAAISVVVLALGIGLCSFMFSVVYGLYFRGLDVPEGDRIAHVYSAHPETNQTQSGMPILDFLEFQERQRSFDELAYFAGGTVNITGPDGTPRRYAGTRVSAGFLSLTGLQPVLGRSFETGDDAPGSPPNVVLGYNAWRDDYGADRSVLGANVRVNGEPATVIGVMPEGFEFPNNTELWIPNRTDPLSSGSARGARIGIVGLLSPGVDIESAEAEAVAIAAQLSAEYSESNEGWTARVMTVVEANMSPQLDLIFGAMMIAVICVLLVACANVANLLLARASVRTKEAGVRVAMGGGRLRVMMPFFAEALVLAAVGSLLGIGIAYLAVDWFDTITDPSLTGRPYFMRFVIDLPILLFVAGLGVLTAIAAGIAPALQVSRTDVGTVLKDQSRGSSSLHLGKLSRALVTAEIALSCALLVGAGLMAKSILNVDRIDFSYETERVLTARVGLFATDYPDTEDRQRFWTDLRREVEAMPAVEAAGLTDRLPFAGNFARPFAITGEEYSELSDLPSANRAIATPGLFDALGVSVLEGRDFTESDGMGSELVALVNEPFVARYLPGRDPLGVQFREGSADTLPVITIVGVVPDLDMQGNTPQGFPGYEPAGYYVPLAQTDANFLSVAALSRAGGAAALTPDLRSVVRRLDPELPIYDVWTQAEVIERGNWFYATFGAVFIVFGLAALFMASVGLYGVLSFAVSRRTQEMGIRMALGAGAAQVVGLVAKQGAKQLGIGMAIGMVMALGLTRLVGFFLYQVDPQDPTVFAAVFVVILVVGLAAAVLPARRATGVSPVVALRSD